MDSAQHALTWFQYTVTAFISRKKTNERMNALLTN